MNRGKQRKAGRLWARVALAAAVLVALALPLGAGSAVGSAPSVISPLAGGIQCNSGDPYWCLTIGVSPTSGSPGTVTVDDCVTGGTGTQGNCPSGMFNRTTDYPATCPTNSFCSKGGLGIPADDTVVLTAVPSSTGWAFSRWSSGNTTCTGGIAGNPCSFTMPAMGTQQTPQSITANFIRLWQLGVSVSPSGGGTVRDDAGKISCPTITCRARYSDGTPVSLTESAAPGYRFTGWRGACTNSTGGCTLTMDSDKDVTANFVRVFTLTIGVSGNGSVSYSPVGDGSGTCTSSCVVHYDIGTTSVTLTASNGSDVFTGWGGDCASSGAQSSCTLTMDAAKNVTANFGPLFKLTLAVTGNGSVTYSPAGNGTGSCSSSCTVQFVQNTGVTMTAVDGTDSFSSWAGDCTGTQKSCALTMGADKSVTAAFTTLIITAPRFELTVGVTGSGKVTTSGINCQPACQADYPAGSSLTLVAVPEPGLNFQTWGGACASFGTQATCKLLMDNDKSVTATFSADPVIGDLPPCPPAPQAPCDANQLPEPKQSLAVSLSGADGGKVTGGPSGGAHTLASSQDTPPSIACGADTYVCYGDYGTSQSVTLTAKPAPGFRFTGWTGACTGKKRSCTLSLSEARNVTAAFAPKGKRVLNLSMKVAAFHVGWRASVGSGQLIVTGRIARPAQLTFDLRRPHAGPLVHLTKAVTRAGAFRIPLRLPSRLFPKGAKLLPGGKVISIRGKARGFYVPMQVRTVPLHGPPEGVVRRSFASVTRAGRNVPVLPASSQVAWANFQLEQQPAASLGVKVYWFQPNGRVLGSVRKANRPVVSSFLRSGKPLPSGCWRAELWAGATRVKRQIVRIGTKRC